MATTKTKTTRRTTKASAKGVSKTTSARTSSRAARKAQSTNAPLTDGERLIIERELVRELERATRTAGAFGSDLAEVMEAQGHSRGDSIDAANDISARENASLISDRSSSNLRETREALRRLRNSPEKFGICESCEKPIGFARLDVMPTAKTCKSCATGRA